MTMYLVNVGCFPGLVVLLIQAEVKKDSDEVFFLEMKRLFSEAAHLWMWKIYESRSWYKIRSSALLKLSDNFIPGL